VRDAEAQREVDENAAGDAEIRPEVEEAPVDQAPEVDEPASKKRKQGRQKGYNTPKAEIERQKEIKEAMEYRRMGYTYRQIAEQMEVAPSTAYKWVAEGLANRCPRSQCFKRGMDVRLQRLFCELTTSAGRLVVYSGLGRSAPRRDGVMLSVIKGNAIKEITTADDYLSILFEDVDAGLNVFNNYSIDVGSLQDLVGKRIEDIFETAESIRIMFNNGTCLQIGMRDCDYNGPESLIYFASGNFYVETYQSDRRHQFRS